MGLDFSATKLDEAGKSVVWVSNAEFKHLDWISGSSFRFTQVHRQIIVNYTEHKQIHDGYTFTAEQVKSMVKSLEDNMYALAYMDEMTKEIYKSMLEYLKICRDKNYTVGYC